MTYLDRRGRCLEVLTGDNLLERALLRAAVLEEALPEGATCLLVMPAGPEFLLTLLGCLFAGMVAVPLPEPGPGAQADRLNGVLATSGVVALLCVSTNVEALQAHLATAPDASACALLPMDTLAPGGRAAVSAGLRKDPGEIVIVQYTSGSTRQPKGVALSSGNMFANAELVFSEWRLRPGDITVNWLPHYHDMGLLGGMLYPLIGGQHASTVQMPPLAFIQHPARWLQTISQYRARVSGAPAFALGLCVDHVTDEQLQQLDLSCWEVAFCGAEPVSADVLQRFRHRFQPTGFQPGALFASYGIAEATLFVAGRRQWADEPPSPSDEQTRLAPARLSPETRASLRIVDPLTLEVLPDGETGEIWVGGPSVAGGYVQAGDTVVSSTAFHAHVSDSTEAYLRTGDLGWIGVGGLYISGRLKDMLIANGVNVAAVDVEWLAAGCHPDLNPLAAAAVPLAVDEGHETGALLIEVKSSSTTLQGADELAAEIQKIVRSTYGINLKTVQFLKRGSLERTTSGKIRRQRVLERLRQGVTYPIAIYGCV